MVLLSETHWVDYRTVASDTYNCFFKNRTDRSGGGVAILLKKSLQASPVKIPNLVHIECIGVSMSLPKNESLVFVQLFFPKNDFLLRNWHFV